MSEEVLVKTYTRLNLQRIKGHLEKIILYYNRIPLEEVRKELRDFVEATAKWTKIIDYLIQKTYTRRSLEGSGSGE